MAGHTVRADVEGGAVSSDFGPLLLRGVDRQMGLTERLAAALRDQRHQSYVEHPWRDLLAQRLYHIASGYADGHDAHSWRHDPLFQLGVARLPWEPDHAWARAPTFSRLEPSVERQDLSRLPRACVAHCIASSPAPPAASVLDLEHADDPTPGPQACAFSNHYSKNDCD